MATTIRVQIVSAEKNLFDGEATMVVATAAYGEMGILPGHAPLLADLSPGQIRVQLPNDGEKVFYVSGGIFEVQPNLIIVLADTAERAENVSEAAAAAAKERAEKLLSQHASDIDYAAVRAELAQAVAQLAALQRIRKITK